MTQAFMTEAERTKALQDFGYTQTEAQFLLLPALHGGYFFRRQYGQFLGKEDGGTVSQVVQKALGLNHAKATTWRQNTQLYHLCARPFYEAIGQGDNRNRRMRERNAIKAKIMALDYVLTRRDRRFLATDQERFDYFIRVLQVPVGDLPSLQYRARKSNDVTTRYFVEKFPIYVTEAVGLPPVVTFSFIDEGLAGLSAFESFLARYSGLFEALETFELVYVAANPRHFQAAAHRFQHFTIGGDFAQLAAQIQPESIAQLLEYFELRQAYEAGHYKALDRDKLIALRNGRETFSAKEYGALFKLWKTGGEAVLRQILARQKQTPASSGCAFSTCLLEHDYSVFAMVAAA